MENLSNPSVMDEAHNILRDFELLAGQRAGNWESHWTEIAERVAPQDKRLFLAMNAPLSQGEKRNEEVFDATAMSALDKFGAILDSLLTPKNVKWHGLTATDRSIMRDRQARLYFEEANEILFSMRYNSVANFSGQNQVALESVGLYGTGSLFIDGMLNGRGTRYKAPHLSEVFFAENHQGLIDKAYRRFSMTGRQIAQQWPNKTPPNILEKNKANPEQSYEVLHCVKPGKDYADYDPTRKDYRGKEFRSTYILREGKVILERGGYVSFPYPTARWKQTPKEVYGRSPAMAALPAIKTANEQKRQLLRQGQRVLDPVLLAHDDGVLDGFSLRPGAMNYGGVNKDGRALVQVLPTGNIAVGKDNILEEQMIIKDIFLVTLFQILMENPQMTATEVIERTRQQGILLAPTVGRLESEYVSKVIERELDVLSLQGVLPPMPQILIEARGEYQIVHQSPISRAQRAEEAAGTLRTIEAAVNVATATQNAEPLDHFDWDVIVPEIADINGVPERFRRSLDAVMEIRQSRQEAANRQEAVQAAPGAAAMIKAGAAAKKVGGI